MEPRGKYAMKKAAVLSSLVVAVVVAVGEIAEAQQAKKIPRIGYLSTTSPIVASPQTEAFREALNQLGYIDGENIVFEWRYAEGSSERLAELAAELVKLNVDVIVTGSTPAIRAVQQTTKTIPIVMTNVGDPVAEGFVANLARPGGNITGFTNLSPDLSTKRLELIKDIAPKVSRVAVFSNAAQHGPAMKNMEAAAQSLRLRLIRPEVRTPDDLEAAFKVTARERADALITMPNPLFRLDSGARKRIVDFTLKQRIPSMYEGNHYVVAGGLASYGQDERSNYRRAANYVDKILKGTKPADLPVEQPMKFEFVINLKTAKQIGLTIPPNVLARADRVIK
jgi:putative ABC transport system substrate-binding protein